MNTNSKQTNSLSLTKKALLALKEMQSKLDALEYAKNEPIAIIGMGCRFPGGIDNPTALLSILRDGIDTITEVPKKRWDIDAYYDPNPEANGKMYTRHGSFIKNVDNFDAGFFNISPREAKSLDPQHRLLLEVSWQALENSYQLPEQLYKTPGGVFLGIGINDYGRKFSATDDINAYYGTGNVFSAAAGRLSYFLGLTGPSMVVDTACSSSLVAVHLACQSLRNQECNLALAGGVNLVLSPETIIGACKARMLSPEGYCKTFDASADGYVRGEGCGVIVLKRFSDAVKNQDNILAVIRGSAINQDGPSGGLTVPNGPSQEKVIRQALENGGVKPSMVSYIEAHGTGTSLGDPIEVEALGAVFGQSHSPENPLLIGSLKTNLGHLEAAAGIAGLMKVVLQLQHQEIFPHLHLKEPSPYIDWDNLPVNVPTHLIPWATDSQKRIGGTSSFGFSGTNAHVILEEAPKTVIDNQLSVITERPWHILTLSAKSKEALRETAQNYEAYLDNNTQIAIADICFTANVGRTDFNHRLAIVASEPQELATKLAKIASGVESAGIFTGQLESQNEVPKIAFLFTGQGSQYVEMGRQLYQTQPVFRQTLDQCAQILQPYLDKPLLEVIYPAHKTAGEIQNSLLDQTAYTQPALFAIEYALYKLWSSWGIKPDVVMGHSVGEYVAACIAGVFSLEDALQLIAHRGRLMQQLPPGGEMVAVMASESKVQQLIASEQEQLAIAAINGPESTVISGAGAAMGRIREQLAAVGIKTKQLAVSHAFHSPLMEPMLADFEAVAHRITYNSAKIALISNVTGTRADESIATANYWVNHVRQPVQFAPSVASLHQEGVEIFLEIGPKPILLGMARQCLPEGVGVYLPSLRENQADWAQMLPSLAELHVRGVKVDWLGFDRDYNRQKVVLPTYPFQRQRYWIETSEQKTQKTKSSFQLKSVPQTNLPHHIFCLSGHNRQDLLNLAKRILSVIEQNPEIELETLCFLANTKDLGSEHRLALIVQSTLELQTKLDGFVTGEKVPGLLQGNFNKHKMPKLAFLFSNHGTQYHGMGKELYETQPIFRQAFDECDQIFSCHLEGSLYEFLYADESIRKFRYENIEYSIPALFSLEYALVQLWKSWGIESSLVTGISLGEYPAAHTAGVWDLKSVLTLIALVTKEIQEIALPNNIAIGVITSVDKLEQLIQPYSEEITIISYGGSRNFVSGPAQAILELKKELKNQKISIIPLARDPYGFHTSNIDNFTDKMQEKLKQFNFSKPVNDYLSHVKGKLVSSELMTLEYWIDHLRDPVQLSQAAKTFYELNYEIIVEIGPQITSSALIRDCFPKDQGIWLPSLRKLDSDWKQILTSLGQLYVHGMAVNWEGFYQCYPQHIVSLPEHLFDETFDSKTIINRTSILDSLEHGNIEQINEILQATGELSDIEKSLTPKLLKLICQQHQKELNNLEISEDLTSEQDRFKEKSNNILLSKLKKSSDTEREVILRDYLQDCIAGVLEMRTSQVDIKQPLVSMGVDSLMAFDIRNQVQSDLEIDIPISTLIQNPNIENLAIILLSSFETSTKNPILVPIKNSGNQAPLFCIHPIGGNIFCYANLARHLDQDYPVYGIQSLGLDGQEQPLTSIEEMATCYIEAIKKVQPQGPFHLIGWSMGGIIAYEIARQLNAKNQTISLLALIDSYAPNVVPLPAEVDQTTAVNLLAREMSGLNGKKLDLLPEKLSNLQVDQQVKYVFQQAKQQAIFPPEIEIEQMQNLWEVFQSNSIAFYKYQPQAYPGSMILLNSSEIIPELNGMANLSKVIEDPQRGWESLVLDGIQTHTIPGDHYTILQSPQVERLSAKINNHLQMTKTQQDRKLN